MEKELHLGNISIQRDWGWAPEYVEAMWRMLQQDEADDYVIATGETHSLEDFVRIVFESVGLDWGDHVVADETLLRPADIQVGAANPAKAFSKLKWKAEYKMPDVARMMVEVEQENS